MSKKQYWVTIYGDWTPDKVTAMMISDSPIKVFPITIKKDLSDPTYISTYGTYDEHRDTCVTWEFYLGLVAILSFGGDPNGK